ncbi:hypothetical protein ACHAWX_006306 [Stephanocyclus meneghinianus]
MMQHASLKIPIADDEMPRSRRNIDTERNRDEDFACEFFELPRKENRMRWNSEDVDRGDFRALRRNEATVDGFFEEKEPFEVAESKGGDDKSRTPLKSLTNTMDRGEASHSGGAHSKKYDKIPTTALGRNHSVISSNDHDGGRNSRLSTPCNHSNFEPSFHNADQNASANFSELIGISRPMYQTADDYGFDHSNLFRNFALPSIKNDVEPQDSPCCFFHAQVDEDSPANYPANTLLSEDLSVIEEGDEETDSEDTSITCDFKPLHRSAIKASTGDFDSGPIFDLGEATHALLDNGIFTTADHEDGSAAVNFSSDTAFESRRVQGALGPLLGNKSFRNTDSADYYVDESFHNDQEYPGCPSVFSECFLSTFIALFLGKRQCQDCVIPVDCCSL